MLLNAEQRLHRLKTRVGELALWRARERLAVGGWTFDDAPIEVGALWPRCEGIARFRAKVEVPEGWPIEDARLSLNVGGESLLTLVYDDGAGDSFGLDPNHEEFALRRHQFRIETESAARLPFGQPARAPRLERAELIRLDRAVDNLAQLVTLVIEAGQALGDHEVVAHLIEAAEAALRGLDWPSATADYVARVAPSRLHQTIWRLPQTDADPPGLDEAGRAGVVAASEGLVAALKHLQRRFPPQGEIALTGHAHIDLAWLWPYDETRRKLRRTFSTALRLIERASDFRFNQSTAHYYAEIEANDPALFAEIRVRVASGAWELIGGMWVEPDTNMPTGESLARQVLYGQGYFARAFGERPRVCWLPDCFGFSPALPQILRLGGLDSFFTIKVNWSETNKFPYDLFWWEGLDGSRVLAHAFDNPFGGYNGMVAPGSYLQTWKNFRGKVDHSTTLLAVGYGDGGGGATPEMIARAARLADFPALPRARWTRVADFFAAAHLSARTREAPEWVGEIYLERHRGTLTTQGRVKRKHRLAERALIAAETVASLVHLLGGARPDNLESLWRPVLKNEFHDILPGSSIREVYEDAEQELGGVIEGARARQGASLGELIALLPKGALDEALVAVNPSLSPRPLRARLPDGGTLATDDIVPALGVAVLDSRRLAPTPGLKASARHIENASLSVEIAADGTIASLVHKPSGREALAGPGNQLWAFPQDKPRDWDAWDIEEDYARRGEPLGAVERIEPIRESESCAGMRISRRYRDSSVAQTYRLFANSRRLDIATQIDWRERRVMLRALTPAAVRAERATFECAYGVIERPTHANTSWDAAMFEAAAHRFVDLSEPGFGLALLNDGKYGHSVRRNIIGLSLLRSPAYPDPLADEGLQDFTYSLMPHAGDWRAGGVREEAEDLNQPLLTTFARRLAAGVLTPIEPFGVPAALSAFKAAEDGSGLVLRVYEPNGARGAFGLTLTPGWRAGGPIDLLEEPLTPPRSADLRPFEVRSLRLTRVGPAA